MGRPPTPLEFVFSVLLFTITSAAVLVPAWRRSRRAAGAFRWLHYLPALPMVYVSARVGWDTAQDVTADNLWPIAFVMYAVPSVALYVVIRFAEYRVWRRSQPG